MVTCRYLLDKNIGTNMSIKLSFQQLLQTTLDISNLLSSRFVCIDKDGTDCFVRDIESSTRYRDLTVF